jgi:hypothetical protein
MELVENDENDVNIAVAADMAQKDRRIAPSMIAEFWNIPKTVGIWILKDIWKKERSNLELTYQNTCT